MNLSIKGAKELASISSELIAIATDNWEGFDAWTESENGILSSPRVRELGEQANRIGGFEAMQTVAYAAFTDANGFSRGGSVKAAALSEINCRWNGIGDWQA